MHDQRYDAIRVSAGIQGSGFVGLGYSRLWYTTKGFFGGANALYGMLEWNVSHHLPMYGVKLGGEAVWGIFAGGLEVKYLTDFHQGNIMATPRIGLSLVGFGGVFYGYNWLEDEGKLPELSHHQLEVNVTLSRRIVKEQY